MAEFAPRVDPDAALAWWWDFEDGAGDHAFLWVRTRRRVLARSPTRVEAEERAPFFRERWCAWRDADQVRFEGRNGFADFEGSYRFSRRDRGVQVVLEATVRLRGFWRVGAWLAPPVVRWVLRRDLHGHVKQLMRELAP